MVNLLLIFLVGDGIEYVIHYNYTSSSYGMHLSQMTYSSANCTSHVILSDTEHDAAKSMIEQLKYGNQVFLLTKTKRLTLPFL